jgi:hypothetical protein
MRRFINSIQIHRIFLSLACLLLLGVVVLSFTRPLIPWDSWAYHFPFSAQLLNINQYAQSFGLEKSLQVRYEGFPLIAEFLQGILWKFTGSLSSTALLNSISLCLFVWCAHRFGKANLTILVFGILSIPMIAIHATSTYIDLFFGIGVAFQYLFAIIIYKEIERIDSVAPLKIWGWCYVISAFVLGNTKMWGPILSLAISAFLFIAIVFNQKIRVNKNILRNTIFVLAIASVLSCSTLIKNALVHSNPIYPIAFKVPILNLQLSGPEIEYKNTPGYAEQYGVLSRPFYFLTSITEYDWAIRGVTPYYNVDMGSFEKPKNYAAARTGGWWGLNIVISISLLAALCLLPKATKSNRHPISFFPLTLFIFITGITSFMPQSHELRYFLYWPIVLMFNLAYLVTNLSLFIRYTNVIAALYIGLFIFSLIFLQNESIGSLITYKSERELIGIDATAIEVLTAKQFGGICLGPSYSPYQFNYSAVLQGGNYFIEQGNCLNYPEFKK